MPPSPDTPLAEAIDQVLPQTQCTRCGYPDCRAYAEAIATGQAGINQCPPGGAEGIARLAALTGREPLPLNPANGTEGPRGDRASRPGRAGEQPCVRHAGAGASGNLIPRRRDRFGQLGDDAILPDQGVEDGHLRLAVVARVREVRGPFAMPPLAAVGTAVAGTRDSRGSTAPRVAAWMSAAGIVASSTR